MRRVISAIIIGVTAGTSTDATAETTTSPPTTESTTITPLTSTNSTNETSTTTALPTSIQEYSAGPIGTGTLTTIVVLAIALLN